MDIIKRRGLRNASAVDGQEGVDDAPDSVGWMRRPCATADSNHYVLRSACRLVRGCTHLGVDAGRRHLHRFGGARDNWSGRAGCQAHVGARAQARTKRRRRRVGRAERNSKRETGRGDAVRLWMRGILRGVSSAARTATGVPRDLRVSRAPGSQKRSESQGRMRDATSLQVPGRSKAARR